MKSIKISIISVISTLSLITNASALTPPALTEVMQKNETFVATTFPQNRVRPIQWVRQLPTYSPIISGKAVTLYRYDNLQLWVQELDLQKGARISSILQLGGYDDTTGEPLYMKKSLDGQTELLYEPYFSLVNGQFFNPNRNPTTLSLGLKRDGEILSIGADNENVKGKNILFVDGGTVRIMPYSWETFRADISPFAMVNFSLEKGHYPNERIGRTYICIPGADIEGKGSKLLIWTAIAMTELDIEREMLRWGCSKSTSSKLDSSGSTRLLINGEKIYGNAHKGTPDYRTVPHSIAIHDAP